MSSSSCAELATNLSANYLSPALYDGVSPLADFLSVTGILLSMCVMNNCTGDPISHNASNLHLSGSWIQELTTGPRTFGFGRSNFTGIGMVLDPYAVDIRCIYPLDGVSDVRYDQGCGGINFDGVLSWFQRQTIKALVYWRKVTHFLWTKWEDIPCSQLLSVLYQDHDDKGHRHPGGRPGVVGMDDDQSFKSFNYWAQKQVALIMGHTVCYDDVPQPDFQNDEMLAYFGEQPWAPAQWNENSAVTQRVVEQHPDSRGVFNEVVMTKVTNYTKVIRTLFYVRYKGEDPSKQKELAYEEARRLGVECVLEFDPQADNTGIFKSPSAQVELSSLVDSELTCDE